MAHDWRPEIVRMVQLKRAIQGADTAGIWEFHLPKVAASASVLSQLEATLGWNLDPEYREFLGYADGWPSFFQSVDLFGTDDLVGGPRMQLAREALEALEPQVLEKANLRVESALPIAATTVDLDLFVMEVSDGVQVPPVVWLAGEEIDRFANFTEFVLAMIEYNARELEALQSS